MMHQLHYHKTLWNQKQEKYPMKKWMLGLVLFLFPVMLWAGDSTAAVADTSSKKAEAKEKAKPQKEAEEKIPDPVVFNDITCVPGMVGVKTKKGRFCIDQYEFPNHAGKFPLTQVTWSQAAQYCKDSGKRLCKDSEWMAACEGPQKLKYGYGQKYRKDRCQTEGKYFVKSGTFPDCHSVYGAFDMVGNAGEWTSGGGVVTFGGSWDDDHSAHCTAWQTRSIDKQYNDAGFRCCLDAK
jgi:formylglycine-generating enzyme required for sulfatase activity